MKKINSMSEILIIRVVSSILVAAGIVALAKLVNKMRKRAKDVENRLRGE